MTESRASSEAKRVAILGVTGRLGPAVARAFPGWEVRGLSRRAPREGEAVAGVALTLGDRSDAAALAAVCEGADVVVDLLCLRRADAETLLAALEGLAHPPRHLVFASSIAELPARDRPVAPDGAARRDARALYEERFRGVVHSLVLPRLVAGVDHAQRERLYLDAALAGGRALHAGDGRQRQTIAPVEGVAAVVRALADAPARVPAGPLLVGPPAPVAVADAIAALLEGAGAPAALAPHPDRGWRGPHGGGSEVVDTRTLQRALPELVWPDVLDVHRRLGAFLAATPPRDARPPPLVALRSRSFRGRRLIDVHRRRDVPPALAAEPGVARLASWLTPSFYVDLGRPCNSACLYCAVPPHADTEGFAPMERVRAQLAAGRDSGCSRAIFIGGEPTIHPHLEDALALLRDSGQHGGHVLMTNGLRLADAAFLERLNELGITTLHLSIDTADDDVYAALSRTSGTLLRQHDALRNALRLRDRLHTYVYVAMTRLNAPGVEQHLERLAAIAREEGAPPPPVVLAFVKPLGDALAHAPRLLLSPAERAERARAGVAAGRALGVDVALRNLQACLAPELAPLFVDYYLEDFAVDVETGERVGNPHVAAHESFAAACARCAHADFCAGVYSDDRALFGDDAYRALPGFS